MLHELSANQGSNAAAQKVYRLTSPEPRSRQWMLKWNSDFGVGGGNMYEKTIRAQSLPGFPDGKPDQQYSPRTSIRPAWAKRPLPYLSLFRPAGRYRSSGFIR